MIDELEERIERMQRMHEGRVDSERGAFVSVLVFYAVTLACCAAVAACLTL